MTSLNGEERVQDPSTGEPQLYVQQSVFFSESESEDLGWITGEQQYPWNDFGCIDEIPEPDRSLPIEEQNAHFPHDELYASLDQLKHFSPRENQGDFAVSDLAWAKIKNHQWWSGHIFKQVAALESALKHHKIDCSLLVYFGDKGFASSVSEILKTYRSENSSETFKNAVDYALKVVSSRVQLGLACTCVSGEILDKLRLKSVENLEVQLESSERDGVDISTSFNSFEPDKVKYMKLLEEFPFSQVDIETTKSTSLNSFELDKLHEYLNLLSNFLFSQFDKIDITIAEAQLSNFCHNWFRLYGSSMEEDSVLIEDASIKRKAVDLVSDRSKKQPTLYTESAQKPSFKTGASSQKVATQLTAPGDQSNLLSQLHLTTHDPMEAHTSSSTIGPCFSNHSPFLPLVELEAAGIGTHNPWKTVLGVTYLLPFVVSKSRQMSSEARTTGPSVVTKSRQSLATELLMKYPEGSPFPCEIELNEKFSEFGSLVQSETKVDRESGRARVVFKNCLDAMAAAHRASVSNMFGAIDVAYVLKKCR